MNDSHRGNARDFRSVYVRYGAVFSLTMGFIACGHSRADDATADTRGAARSEPCVVQEAPKVLADALCAGSSSALQTALDSLKDKDESPNFFDVIPVMERIWLRDRSLGKGLPWNALTNTDVRGTIVRNLAQQVRLGRSKLALRDFQSFAVKLSREDAPLGASEGINLIGFTHAPGQVGFLQRVLASPTEPSQRPVAIWALGMVCDDEARGVLAQMLNESIAESADQKRIKDAIAVRATLGERTCRLARGETK